MESGNIPLMNTLKHGKLKWVQDPIFAEGNPYFLIDFNLHHGQRSAGHVPAGSGGAIRLEGSWKNPSLRKARLFNFYRGEASEAPPVKVHFVKSIS